jgi:HNH endonuclease
MKTIPLTQGKVALVDDEDFNQLNQWKWHVSRDGSGKKFYALRYAYITGKRVTVHMHRLIMNAKEKLEVDHIDGDGLNNQRNNLRLCTHAENVRNYQLPKHNKSGYKGVHWNKQQQKWRAAIKVNNKEITLGHFKNIMDAVAVRDQKARELHGEFANTNL